MAEDQDQPKETPPVFAMEVRRNRPGFDVRVTSGGLQSQDWTELRDAYIAALAFLDHQIGNQDQCPARPMFGQPLAMPRGPGRWKNRGKVLNGAAMSGKVTWYSIIAAAGFALGSLIFHLVN